VVVRGVASTARHNTKAPPCISRRRACSFCETVNSDGTTNNYSQKLS